MDELASDSCSAGGDSYLATHYQACWDRGDHGGGHQGAEHVAGDAGHVEVVAYTENSRVTSPCGRNRSEDGQRGLELTHQDLTLVRTELLNLQEKHREELEELNVDLDGLSRVGGMSMPGKNLNTYEPTLR